MSSFRGVIHWFWEKGFSLNFITGFTKHCIRFLKTVQIPIQVHFRTFSLKHAWTYPLNVINLLRLQQEKQPVSFLDLEGSCSWKYLVRHLEICTLTKRTKLRHPLKKQFPFPVEKYNSEKITKQLPQWMPGYCSPRYFLSHLKQLTKQSSV